MGGSQCYCFGRELVGYAEGIGLTESRASAQQRGEGFQAVADLNITSVRPMRVGKTRPTRCIIT